MANRYYAAGLRTGEDIQVREAIGSNAPVQTGFAMLALAGLGLGVVMLAKKMKPSRGYSVQDTTASLKLRGLTPRKFPQNPRRY